MSKVYTRAEDLCLLEKLHLKDNRGLTFAQIAERFGVSRSSVAGSIDRVNAALAPCAAKNPENRDGGMPERWWA